MKHLVVVAHPAEASFTFALTRAYTDELELLGHTTQTYDLYRMGFNPVLAAHELEPISADNPVSPDVARAQEDIRAADVLPAIMKGYVDRVFARGFAYESQQGIVHGLLSGKKSVLITLSGAPLPLLVKSGNWNAVQILQDTHILRSAGFELLDHVHFDVVVPQLAPGIAEQYLAEVRACVRTHFRET